MPGKCRFKTCWLENSLYSGWLLPDSNVYKAKCKVCVKQIDVANMGESALASHVKSKKHKDCVRANTRKYSLDNYVRNNGMKTATTSTYFDSTPTLSSSELGSHVGLTVNEAEIKCLKPVGTLIRNSDTRKAEILWTLKSVTSHYSSKSCESNAVLFQTMFPDSKIARSYSCGERKTAYLINHGLKPYFLNKLLDSVNSKDMYVLLFDEAMNKKLQEKQLDLHVRYYDETNKHVQTYFLDSAFMGHGRASDLVKNVSFLTEKLNLSYLLQISMDGPNVNLKFVRDFKTDVLEQLTDKKLLDIGTCSLHKMHNVFRGGFKSTGWCIEDVMKNMYDVFKDSPARRDDLVVITGQKQFPMKFCSHRWVENESVANRALLLLPEITNYIKIIESDKKYTTPTSKTFMRLKEACQDRLTTAKLHFFISVAEHFTPYLQKYQTDNPMLPFVADDVEKLLQSIMSRVLKKDVVENLNTKFKLANYEYSDSDTLPQTKVDIGFSAEKFINKSLLKKEITDCQKLKFYLDCKNCLSVMLQKLFTNNPLLSTLVRCSSCFKPSQMVNTQLNSQCCKQLKKILTVLTNANRFDERKCDVAIRQYSTFLNETVAKNISKFSNFDYKNNRLDLFFSEFLFGDVSFTELWFILRCILVLSHGQASVERGFSVNAKITVENKTENTYTAQRIIHDSVRLAGGVMNVKITDELISYAKSSRSKYEQYLKLNKEKSSIQRKRKEIEDVNEKKKRLKKDIEHLQDCVEKAAEEAERTAKRECFVRFNSFRKAVLEKKEELKRICENI